MGHPPMRESDNLELRASGATIKVVGDRLIKRQSPSRSRVERERTQFGYRIALMSGLFEVPEIVGFDDVAGEITFRVVPGAVPLRDYLIDRPEPELVRRCGRVLAAIHSADYDVDGCDVRWHGDFGHGNILYAVSRDRIIVVDWNNASWWVAPPHQGRGSPGLDLGVAVISLFSPRGIRARSISDPDSLSRALLSSYVQGREVFEIDSVRPFILTLNRRWRRCVLARSGILRALAYTPAMVRLSVFWSTVSTHGL